MKEEKEKEKEKTNMVVLELRSCVKVEVAVLGFPTLIVHRVSVAVKQH